jgi:hypothetical protein
VVVPPLFKTAPARRCLALALSWLCLGWLLLYVASLAMWIVLVPLINLATKADAVLVLLFGVGTVPCTYFRQKL